MLHILYLAWDLIISLAPIVLAYHKRGTFVCGWLERIPPWKRGVTWTLLWGDVWGVCWCLNFHLILGRFPKPTVGEDVLLAC